MDESPPLDVLLLLLALFGSIAAPFIKAKQTECLFFVLDVVVVRLQCMKISVER